VDFVGDVVHELARGFDLGRHLGDLEPDRLEVANRMTEGDAFLRVADRIFKAAARKPDRSRRGVHARDLEAAERRTEGLSFAAAFALATEERISRQPQIVEMKFPGLPSEVADLANRRAAESGRKLAALFQYQELADSFVTPLWIGRLLGARQHR